MDKTGREQPGKICTALTTRKAYNQNHLKGKLVRVGCIGVMLGGLLAGCSGDLPHTPIPTLAVEATLAVPTLKPTTAPTEYPSSEAAPTLEPVWSLEIPDSPDKCTNVITKDSFEKTTLDITSLNKKIIESRPAGEVFPKMVLSTVSSDFMKHTVAPFDFFDIVAYPQNGDTSYNKLLSCSNYGDGIVLGMFLPVGTGDQQTLIPVQVFFDRAVLKQQYESQGLKDPRYDIQALANNNEGKIRQTSWRLDGHFSDTKDQYKNSLEGLYGQYLDETYDYSNRLELLMNHFGENPQRDAETIALFQTIMLPGTAAPIE